MISIQTLRKSFGTHEVLRGVDLQLEAGRIHGIVGENGAGKTTLFRCIAQLEDFQGSIDAGKLNLRRDLGFLSTDPFFFPFMTGTEYLRLQFNAHERQVPPFAEYNLFDLPLEQYASTYSTGMKKKLALMALLLLDLPVYLLDEPFNGVDIHSNMLIVRMLEELRKREKTVIISSHIFSTLKESCDVIHHLKDGTICNSAHPAEFSQLEKNLKGPDVELTFRIPPAH
ncbi:MAG: ATP-binding cassette domain-containing protein [Flavobacteriales bacterium]|nr:ATP-binding cassette domain-containing protein [Flavobacteriales bacterium]